MRKRGHFRNLITNQCPFCDAALQRSADEQWISCTRRCGFYISIGRHKYLLTGMNSRKSSWAQPPQYPK